MNRSQMMSRVRQKNTSPEVKVRKLLHSLGFRFRLHVRNLPGSPDVVLPQYKTAIFVHGCFWHYHKECRYAKIPATNAEFWMEKLERNVQRDEEKTLQLVKSGWRVIIIWGCAINKDTDNLGNQLAKIIKDAHHPLTEISSQSKDRLATHWSTLPLK